MTALLALALLAFGPALLTLAALAVPMPVPEPRYRPRHARVYRPRHAYRPSVPWPVPA